MDLNIIFCVSEMRVSFIFCDINKPSTKSDSRCCFIYTSHRQRNVIFAVRKCNTTRRRNGLRGPVLEVHERLV